MIILLLLVLAMYFFIKFDLWFTNKVEDWRNRK